MQTTIEADETRLRGACRGGVMKRVLIMCPLMVVAALLAGGYATTAAHGHTLPIRGRVQGHMQSTATCFGCGSLVRYVSADRVWCGWQGKNVIVHVRFRNSSVEHITINWHPSYVIADGGSHGGGLTSIQSVGISAHASQGVYAKQRPKGVPSRARIGVCDPAFSDVQSG